ncbi:MAG: PQQ-binding-like beta-propeller repeat protein [Planctomycetes bacterium]|nr:PQQ-binding-like beta-propeller repeat protein [Planctomycetota bacterium]
MVIADASHVTALDLDSGKQVWSQPLPASPVPWGLAVDRSGHVILTLVDGQVICVGE